MYSVYFTKKFEKDTKLCIKRGYKIKELHNAIEFLRASGTLPVITPNKYNPHKLVGNFIHHWEGHIAPDWLILWLVDDEEKSVTLVRTGTHADLF